MAKLRWRPEKIGKQNVIERANGHYGIGKRQDVTNVSKARELFGSELRLRARPTGAHQLNAIAQAGF